MKQYRIVYDGWNSRIEEAVTRRDGDGVHYSLSEAKRLLRLYADSHINDYKRLKEYAMQFKSNKNETNN